MRCFSNPWKRQKTLRFFNVFREYRKGALGKNELKEWLKNIWERLLLSPWKTSGPMNFSFNFVLIADLWNQLQVTTVTIFRPSGVTGLSDWWSVSGALTFWEYAKIFDSLLNILLTSSTSSERLIYAQFTSCVYGKYFVLEDYLEIWAFSSFYFWSLNLGKAVTTNFRIWRLNVEYSVLVEYAEAFSEPSLLYLRFFGSVLNIPLVFTGVLSKEIKLSDICFALVESRIL